MQHFCSIWAIFYDPWALCPLFIYYWALWGQNFWAKFFYKVALFAKLWALFHWLRLVTLQTKTNGLSASKLSQHFLQFSFSCCSRIQDDRTSGHRRSRHVRCRLTFWTIWFAFSRFANCLLLVLLLYVSLVALLRKWSSSKSWAELKLSFLSLGHVGAFF